MCLCFAVCQFWVSDRSRPRDDAVWQPDSRSSLCLRRFGCLLCYSGLPASGHAADTLCSSGRTQGSFYHCGFTEAVRMFLIGKNLGAGTLWEVLKKMADNYLTSVSMYPAETLCCSSSVFSGVQQPAACCVDNVPLRGRADILPRPVSNTDGCVSLRGAAVLLLQCL